MSGSISFGKFNNVLNAFGTTISSSLSNSVNHSPWILSNPVFNAAAFPLFFSCLIIRIRESLNEEEISTDLSVDPSSITMSSKFLKSCAITLSIVLLIVSALL